MEASLVVLDDAVEVFFIVLSEFTIASSHLVELGLQLFYLFDLV